MNAESQGCLFSQAKHIGLRATSRTPENVLLTILICMQAKQEVGSCPESIQKQDSMVSKAVSGIGSYRGTLISNNFILERLSSWQAHLMGNSGYLKHGEGIWWERTENGFLFHDSADGDIEYFSSGPHLDHFHNTALPDVYARMPKDWDKILENTVVPSPTVRVYSEDGQYQYSTPSLSLPTSLTGDPVHAASLTPTERY